jgi:methyltransferase (TIGR00027 family)
MVAFLRGLSTLGVTQVRDFSDPFAAQLLPAWPARALRSLSWLFERYPVFKERLIVGSRGMLDVVALRSRAIDVSWAEACCAGVRQLVILGAGLDARAYRLPGLEGVSVFEVDHPATQAFKRERARGLYSPAASHTYVPVDLSGCEDDLGRALREAGLRTSERSHVIWEGVTHYLPHRATAATLASIASLASAGSRLVATYAEPEAGGQSSVVRARKWMLRWAGEPHIGLLERTHMARLLEEAGWRMRTDEGLDDLARHFSDCPVSAPLTIRERVVLAEKV